MNELTYNISNLLRYIIDSLVEGCRLCTGMCPSKLAAHLMPKICAPANDATML